PVLVVDYLQIMPSAADGVQTDVQHHTANMSGLCEVAKLHRVPVIVISSMNRQGRNASALASLAGTSAIEYGASAVMFVSVDGKDESEVKANKEAPVRPVTLSVVKNRFGITGDVPLYFKPAESRFIERVGA
ncbi:MAG: DnaB-like helicase C-terminal domain-containing protein, partial [Gordonibacter sp.]